MGDEEPYQRKGPFQRGVDRFMWRFVWTIIIVGGLIILFVL